MHDPAKTYLVITHDPVTGDELLVTRLEGSTSGIAIEGRFHFGWLGQLTSTQLEFVRLLALHRGNVQKVAAELGIAYNTARARGDEIAGALGASGGGGGEDDAASRRDILDRVFDGSLSVDDAVRQLKATGRSEPER